VIGEHREYCPWINSASQSGGGSKSKVDISVQRAGWEVLVRVLEGALHLQLQADDQAAPSFLGGATNDETVEDTIAKRLSEKAASLVSRDEQDKERWARLKKLKKVFDVRSRRKGAVKSALVDNEV